MMSEGDPQKPPKAPREEITPIAADDLDQDLESSTDDSPAPDLYVATEEESRQVEIQKETLGDEQEVRKEKNKFYGIKELKRRQQIRSGLEPIYNLSESDEFDQAEILKKIKPWIEKHGAKPQHFAEVLKYFELAKEIISSEFPPDRRTEVICAFAEVISEGHMDAETLSTLVSKIEPGEQTSENQSERNGYTGVAFFHQAKDGQGAKVIL